mgnify:CR=1 FL=1
MAFLFSHKLLKFPFHYCKHWEKHPFFLSKFLPRETSPPRLYLFFCFFNAFLFWLCRRLPVFSFLLSGSYKGSFFLFILGNLSFPVVFYFYIFLLFCIFVFRGVIGGSPPIVDRDIQGWHKKASCRGVKILARGEKRDKTRGIRERKES